MLTPAEIIEDRAASAGHAGSGDGEERAVDLRQAVRQRRLAAQERGSANMPLCAERNRYDYRELAWLFRLHVPAGAKFLHVSCGLGDTLAAVEPRVGVGLDLSPKIIDLARSRHSDARVRFEAIDPEDFQIDDRFEFILVDHAL